MIIKSYRKDGFGFCGQNIASWTKSWNQVEDVSKSSKNADKDYLSPFFKKYFPYPPKRILEGGCGVGKYVIAYRRLGYDIFGVDFSGETIRRLKEIDKDLPVYQADVTALPFENGFFDCYYSGGVIEHFEEGPDAPLKEARRVLKKDGIFLVTVPYINFLRRLYFSIFPTKKEEGLLRKRCKSCQRDLRTLEGYSFCEYYYDVRSLIPYLQASSFLIEKIHPVDFLWGEMGLPLHKYIVRFQKSNSRLNNQAANEAIIGNHLQAEDKKSFTKDLIYNLLITENRDKILFRFPLKLLNYLSGHMILFVARAI